MSDGAPLDAERLLTTTRSVRRRLDLTRSVDLDTILGCLEVAQQAPNGGDEEAWRWVVVTDPDRRRRIGALYRRANEEFAAAARGRAAAGDLPAARKVASSEVFWDRLDEVPVLVAACVEPPSWIDPSSVYGAASAYGSVFPAVWNFQLACRLQGLGSCLITSHLRYPSEMAEILDLPRSFLQAGIVAVGHLDGGSFHPARRGPLADIVRVDSWSAGREP